MSEVDPVVRNTVSDGGQQRGGVGIGLTRDASFAIRVSTPHDRAGLDGSGEDIGPKD